MKGSKQAGADTDEVLGGAGAGTLAIRGGALRTAGYVVGLAAGLVSVPLLTRHLGVELYGRYVTVISLITIVAIVADAGLTTVGVREYAVRDAPGRDRLIRNILSFRIALTTVGVCAAVAFAMAAGYTEAAIAGTALAGTGLVLAMVQQTYSIPLAAQLRLGSTALLDLLGQGLNVGFVILLVSLGSGLLTFLAVPIPVGAAVLVATVVVVRRSVALRPAVDRAEARYLLAEAVPAAAASALGAVFYRIAIVMMSLLATAEQTGFFSAPFRLVEAGIAVPSLIIGAAYPVLAHLHENDEARFASAFQRLFEVSLIFGAYVALTVVLAAGPIIQFIAGDGFQPSVEVLQVQALGLGATFLVALCSGTLWVVRAKRALVSANAFGVVAVIALTALLIPRDAARGAAVAMTAAEFLLATALGFALLRPRPWLRPSARVVPKVALAIVAGAASGTLVPFADAISATIGSVTFVAVLALTGGLPTDEIRALFRGRTRDILPRHDADAP